MKPIFINGYWRARINGVTHPHCHFTYDEALAACK